MNQERIERGGEIGILEGEKEREREGRKKYLLHDLSDCCGNTRALANLVPVHLLHVRPLHVHQEEEVGDLGDDGERVDGP